LANFRKKRSSGGNLVKKDIFPEIKIDREINIKGRNFKIVGILNSTGDKTDDGAIMVDLDFYREITGDKKWGPIVMAKLNLVLIQMKWLKKLKMN
jgi:hypothetical protein